MRSIIQPNPWTCMPSAYAMCMDVSLQQVMEKLSHDGSRICAEGETPLNRAAFLQSELDVVAIQFGWAPVCLDADPRYPANVIREGYPNLSKLVTLAWPRNIVFVVESTHGPDIYHCVAHDTRTKVFHDPLCGIRPLSELPSVASIIIFFDCRDHHDD